MNELIIKRLGELEAKIDRLLGLGLENYFLDNVEYKDKKLVSGRIRLYGKLSAWVGTDENVMATYQVSATYGAAGNLTTYKVIREVQ